MNKDRPIYNSRIAKNYLNFLAIYYPSVETDEILEYAGMTRYEVEDQVHWFTQQQMDRFQDIIVEKSGNPDISREAGRYLTSSKGMGPVREYTLGFMSPMLVYQAYGKLFVKFAKNATITIKKKRANRVEVTVTPKPGVQEKQYQCENRIGTFESTPKIFTGKYARVEHPVCYHRGHGYCLYVITWDKMPSRLWKRVRNYVLVFSALFLPVLIAYLPAPAWMAVAFIALCATGLLSHYALRLEKKELINTIEYQKEAARENLDQLNARYNNALLVHEIGQAAATIVEIEALIRAVMSAMDRRLDFERGVLMLANEEKTRLVYVSGYGYSKAQEKQLIQTRFHLDRPESKGFFVRAFKDQKSYLLDDLLANPQSLSERSRELARKMNVKSMICVPIIYEKESLGILAVDNPTSGRNLTQSDINLLTGIASQTAVSINNARSFKKLQASEEKYRSILESMEDAYFEVDLEGNFTFVNAAACRFFGSSEKDLIGVNNRQYMDAKTARIIYNAFNKVYRTGIATKVPDWKLIRKDSRRYYVQMLVSLMRNADGEPVGFRGVARDVTEHVLAEGERKRLEARLLQAEKMEAIGTLAGGVAHDLNNVLSGLVSYPELLLMDLPETSPLRKPILTIQKSGQRASAIVQDLLTLARRGVAVADVININQIISDYLKSPEHETIKLNYPGVEIETQLVSNLLHILGSPVHLTKSLTNIVANAAEAMAGGGRILIQSENRYLARPVKGYDQIEKGEYVVLSVSDTGIGISAENINRIFEPFYTKKVMGRSGSGLGMAVVWGTVKDHKGYIDVRSSEGKGTTFTLYFPITRKPLSGEDEAFLLEKIMGKGESILVVDDVKEQREIAMEILRKLRYSVDTVSSGEAAVDFMKTHRADLLVLDMIMEPGMDGLQTYKRILELHPGQKTIIASGFSESERVREAQRLGAGAYVKKPYTTREIGTAVFSELRNRAD